jgi:hypothetical protein
MLVFHFICLTWIFFRAGTFGDAVAVLGGILSFVPDDPRFPVFVLAIVLAIWIYQFIYESKLKRFIESSVVRIGFAVAMILYLFFFRTSGYEVFYYFRF